MWKAPAPQVLAGMPLTVQYFASKCHFHNICRAACSTQTMQSSEHCDRLPITCFTLPSTLALQQQHAGPLCQGVCGHRWQLENVTDARLRSISAELGYCTESARFTFLAKLKISSAASSIQVLTYDAKFSLRGKGTVCVQPPARKRHAFLAR